MAKKKLEQQDGSSTTPQDRRDDLIEKLLRGELDPQQAENQARERGLAPLAGHADPSIFDPMLEPSWSPLMAVAWIVFRDVERVRWAADEYRLKCTHYKPYKKGHDIVAYLKASERTLETTYARFRKANRPLEMTVAQASRELVLALREGDIDPTGIRQGETGRSRIDLMHWEDLKFFRDEHSDTVGGRANCWHKVRLNRDSIMNLGLSDLPNPRRAERKARCRATKKEGEKR